MPRAMLSRHALFCLVVFAASSDAALAKDPWETIVGGRTDKPDGSSSITVGRKLETNLDAKVGADFNLSAPPQTELRPGQSPFIDNRDRSSGAAWANVTLPGPDVPLAWDKQTLDARVDPTQEQSKLGTTFSRSVPVILVPTDKVVSTGATFRRSALSVSQFCVVALLCAGSALRARVTA